MPTRPVRQHVLPALLALGLLAGCERTYTLQFVAQVNGKPLGCEGTYEGAGPRGSTLQLMDFKVYIRDIQLVRANGERWPLSLRNDKRWQRDKFALLDFEDGTGSCNTGSPEVRSEVVGVGYDLGDFTGVEFTLGLPREVNHLNVEWSEPPLDDPSMWWSWKAGYKFLRLDVRLDGNRPYAFHLGASACEGSPDKGIRCAEGNQPVITLGGFDPDKSRIVFDVGALLSKLELELAQADGVTDAVPGCKSDRSDPECPPLLEQLGLMDAPLPSGPDAFIRVE